MQIIKDNLYNFFNCFNIPTIILDNNFKMVFEHKFNFNLRNNFHLYKLIDDIKNMDSCEYKSFSYNNGIVFTMFTFKYNEEINYFIIGPYRLESSFNIYNDSAHDILVINDFYLDKLILLYTHIVKGKGKEFNTLHCSSPSIKRAIKYIHTNYSEDISVEDVCNELKMNKCYFCSMFKKETGYTFINYLNKYKIEKSMDLLKNTNLSLLDISLAVGFNNQSYYSTVFKKITNLTPLEYKEKNTYK